MLKTFKLDFLIIIKFNKEFSSLSAEKFIEKIIYKKTMCKYLYVSKNFRFGFKRRGNIQTLKKFEKLNADESYLKIPFSFLYNLSFNVLESFEKALPPDATYKS